MSAREWARSLAVYVLAVVLCVGLLAHVLRLWRADLDVPLSTGGDCLQAQALVKTLLENGVYYRSERLGAPFGMDLRDYPLPEPLHFGVMKALVLVLGDDNPFRIINYFFLLTFVLTTLSALAVLRHFRLSAPPALAVSLLYAFAPYHFFRGVAHIFLTAYYLVPLMVLVVLWVYLGRLRKPGSRGGVLLGTSLPDPAAPPGSWRRWVVALVVGLMMASGGAYYAFFGCFFLVVAGVACAVRERRAGPLLGAGLLAAVIAGGLFVNLLPFVQYQRQEGPNPDVAQRLPAEAEVYALKIAQMFLPVAGHRVRLLRQWKEEYNTAPCRPLVNDFGSTLGAVGMVGCLFVVGVLFFGPRRRDGNLLPAALGTLTICGMLLGTVGGLGSLFALFVSPQIRCYDRISIYLLFFALFGSAWLLDRVVRKLGQGSVRRRLGAAGLCAAVLCLGILDQTTRLYVPPHAALKAQHDNLAGFVAQVENTLEPGALVLQLPFVEFPEVGPVHGTDAYDHLRLYVHSRGLRWSHGAAMGRFGSTVLAGVCAQPLDAALRQFATMGYSGIHLDRNGYADGGCATERRLRKLLSVEPIVSANGRDLFFDMRPFVERARRPYTEDQWARRQAWSRQPTTLRWGSGAYSELNDGRDRWRCFRSRGELAIVNPLDEERRVTLRFRARAYHPAPAQLTLRGELLEATISINAIPTEFSRKLVVPPGTHVLRFECDAQPVLLGGQTQVFALINPEVVNADPPDLPGALAAER
jgi:phosphoglycerol transferase